MAFSPELLDILTCPKDLSKLELLPDESGLKCLKCGHVYPVIEDIPVMTPEEDTEDVKDGPNTDEATPQSA
jgi:uncharacterized protein YbaR (Trm112 family)